MNSIASAQELLNIARERSGLHDQGDTRFLDALERLVESINAEAAVTTEGRLAASERFIRLLVNRLRFQSDLVRNPDILDQTLQPSLVICGLPRVGSTKLHRMLAEGDAFQSLLFWQGFNPARIADLAPGREDPRIPEAVAFLEWRSKLNPATNAAHFMAALEPEEDTYLLEYTLHTYWPITYFEVPGFLDWLSRQDRDHAFQYVRQLLQYLQWQFHRPHPRPWLLKSPPNLGYERELARHLPGARFVMLHRDPVDVIPSIVAIVREVRRLYCGTPGDMTKVGAWALEEYSSAMNRHVEWRSSIAADRVLDISYVDVRDNAAAVLARVYEFCSMQLSPEAAERMLGWARENAQHKHGQHRYSLEEAGLSKELISRRFSGYLEAFGAYI